MRAERQPMPSADPDTQAREQGYRLIAGVDEVGRGAMAGPVVAAAVILDGGGAPQLAADSKTLTPMQRDRAFEESRALALTWAVGMVRTYAQIAKGREFDYEAWKDSVRAGNTFVTYGPLMEFAVQGKPAGTRIKMNRTGGTVDVTWKLASVTVPMSRVDLIVNGEIRQSKAIRKWEDAGSWSVKIDKSSWLAILVRGHYRDKPEIIAAHSSPVMVELKGSQFLAAADAVTILEQIEGAMAYLDTVSTRAEAKRYKEMRLVLTAAHRELHNRMHQTGHYHAHTPVEDHPEHH